MRLLLVHQNFPGQYKHLANVMRGLPGAQVVALGDHKNIGQRPVPPGLERLTYSPAREPTKPASTPTCAMSRPPCCAARPWRARRRYCASAASCPT